MVAIDVQTETRPRTDVDEGEGATRGSVLDDADGQGGLHAASDLVHLVPVAEPATQLVGAIGDEPRQRRGEGGVDGTLHRAGEVGPQPVVGMVGEDALDAGGDKERRDPIRWDLAGQLQDALVGGDGAEQRRGERPSRVGVRAGPPLGDLGGLVADGVDGGTHELVGHRRRTLGGVAGTRRRRSLTCALIVDS